MELKNRLVRSATYEGMADRNGFPTQDLFRLYERLAKGGVGLIITGFAFVTPDGKSPFLGMQGIHTDDHISRYRELVRSVHESGARIAMQIAHCGRQTTHEAIGTKPMGPSAVFEKSLFVKPREMTEEDIERIIEAFVQAARRVKEAGFDAMQIHAAHGYLINQFLCPHTNIRRDRWGGSLENRMRFVREIYKRCRKQVGDDFPILIKINGTDNMKDALKIQESAVMAQMMGEMGFDGIEVSCGIMEDGFSMLRGNVPIEALLSEWPMYRSKGLLFRFIMKCFGRKIIKPPPMIQSYNRESAQIIKNRVKVPVFLVGGITDTASMEEIIEKGDADYISLCRALIADPAFSEKIRSGSREPSRCIHCNLCGAYLISRPLKCYYGKKIEANPS
ncbi:MAG: NADH:flavin oxidoreductase [Syntrophaceae bacterium]|nr:NADH:flavin oxidoreductase [Syntrophaceae bacterium]